MSTCQVPKISPSFFNGQREKKQKLKSLHFFIFRQILFYSGFLVFSSLLFFVSLPHSHISPSSYFFPQYTRTYSIVQVAPYLAFSLGITRINNKCISMSEEREYFICRKREKKSCFTHLLQDFRLCVSKKKLLHWQKSGYLGSGRDFSSLLSLLF